MGRPVKAWTPKPSATPREVRRAVGYIRVSTRDQAREGYGLGVQREAIEAECARRGWHLVAIHSDEGISGTREDRPGLGAALGAILSGAADALVTYHLTRIGRPREASTLHRFVETLRASGATFVATAQPWIGSDPLTVGIAVAMAQAERDDILRRTASGRVKRAEGGQIVGRPPFGYRVEGARTREARYVIVEAETEVVRRIVAEREAGRTCAAVAEALNAEAIPSPSGAGRWNATRVSEITRNPAYRGTLRWREGEREIVVPGAIPAILATP